MVIDSSLVKAEGGPKDCEIVDSVQRLMSLGLSVGEIKQLDIAEGSLDALCEYARLEEIFDDDTPSDVVGRALDTLAEETRKVDIELQMLNLRKRALTKRAKLLHKLESMLQERANA